MRQPGANTDMAPSVQDLVPQDKRGAELLLAFEDCLAAHKYRVFGVTWALTIPWSYRSKSLAPLSLGSALAVLPDILYANWCCQTQAETLKAYADSYNQHHRAAGSEEPFRPNRR
ncbi:hypothetical protein V8C86DRAFT_2722130 [Haematococcus lacustris]